MCKTKREREMARQGRKNSVWPDVGVPVRRGAVGLAGHAVVSTRRPSGLAGNWALQLPLHGMLAVGLPVSRLASESRFPCQ